MSSMPLQDFFPRIAVYLFIAILVAVGIYSEFLPYNLLWLVPYALLYPQAALLISTQFKRLYPRLLTRSLLVLDALQVGALITLLGYALVPSMMLLLIVAYSALVLGGTLLMLPMLVGILTASAITYLLILPDIQLEANLLLSTTSTLFTLVYVCLIAYSTHHYSLRFAKLEKQIQAKKAKSTSQAYNSAKYLSPHVWQTIFNDKNTLKLDTQRKKLTVFFSDIKGFAELSEELEAEALTDILNNYLNEMSKIAIKYGATIDKFIGDSIMIYFGDSGTQGAKKDAVAAVSMAIEMRKHMKVLRQYWRAQGIDKPLEIRMGINTGYCTIGSFGSGMRMDYTIIGREVNIASRLECAAETNEILISNETHSLTKDVIMARDKGQITVKGISRPVQVYQVVDFRCDLGADCSYVEHELPGFSMYLDTNDIQNYDKERVIEALEEAAERLRDRVIM
ncbi:MAG TPA: adenylate/guanylate cyclase domain-containing protein [Thiopseudomonas sp.]|nr:adenylate/guanylate cyclase domain-containing protein [Thiopseudomonas sp.]